MKKLLSYYLSIIFFLTLAFGAVSAKASSDPVIDGEISGEISVHCFEPASSQRFLNGAAQAFEQRYPGTKVNIIGFSSPTDTWQSSESTAEEITKAVSDYITRVNIEMMSGGGGDIYVIDVLPAYKYADSGQFVDLRGFMDNDPDFDYADYHTSVFDAAMYRGGQYILPTEYYFNIFSYDTQLLDESAKAQLSTIGKYTYDRLFDIAADSFLKHNDPDTPIAIMKISSADTMFSSQLDINFNVFVDVANRKAGFTNGKFAELLNNAVQYEQNGCFGKASNLSTSDFNSMSPLEQQMHLAAMISMKSIYNITPSFGFMSSLISEESKAPQNIPGAVKKGYEVFGLPANINGDVPVDVMHSYAMNANSPNQRTAWAFLKFLISEDMQSLDFVGEFMTVNKNAFLANAKTLVYNVLGIDRLRFEPLPSDAELSESQQAVLDRYIYCTDAFLSLLNTHTDNDYVIRRMINSAVKDFFNGTKTADEVASILQSRVDLYLQE